MSRREFLRHTAVAGAAMASLPVGLQAQGVVTPSPEDIRGAIVLCNHWTQFGIGEAFPEGELRGRWYRRNFSTVYGLEQGRRWLALDSRNRVCHELDAFFLDALAAEDPHYLDTIRSLIGDGRMELVGGTFGQAESQVFGYESAIRQLTFGQAAYQRHLKRCVDTYLVEEQSFFPQLPQLLKLAGFKYASLQFQNSGRPAPSPHDLILWESPDGSSIPTIPAHAGMVACMRQNKPYDDVVLELAGRKAPLIFQWMEIWPPGLDWGASIAPYQVAVHTVEGEGFRQMLLTEYIEWALGRCETPITCIPLDQSNYNNNFFQGGWGYENEKTARMSNRCESLLLAAEVLCAGDNSSRFTKQIGSRLNDLWSRLLVSQNHDLYLAGAVPAYVDGLRSYQSELAVKELGGVERSLQQEAGLDVPLSRTESRFRFFNPCPWEVTTPLLLELNDTVWPNHPFRLQSPGADRVLSPVFRADSGNVLMSPTLVRLPSYGILDVRLTAINPDREVRKTGSSRLIPKRAGSAWEVALDPFADIEFEPLSGEWRQVPSYFDSMHPNINAEQVHAKIETSPVEYAHQSAADGIELATWRRDLMRIRDVAEPALAVHGLAFVGEAPVSFIQFNQRLAGTIRFQTGRRPNGIWRFRIRVPSAGLAVFADAPFSEERRDNESFYCSRYVRLEWPGRHILWCPSQNTRFRRSNEGKTTTLECTVFDFSFSGTANWDMRLYASDSFSPAESFRLAEGFHRKPFGIPLSASAGRLVGIATDNPSVVVTHVFPAGQRASAVRAFNASPENQDAEIGWPRGFRSVALAGLDGRVLDGARSCSRGSRGKWQYQFRPWQVATFQVRYA